MLAFIASVVSLTAGEYIVVNGDTLVKISRSKCGDRGNMENYRSALKIASESGISNPNLILIGQKITLSCTTTVQQAVAELPQKAVELADLLKKEVAEVVVIETPKEVMTSPVSEIETWISIHEKREKGLLNWEELYPNKRVELVPRPKIQKQEEATLIMPETESEKEIKIQKKKKENVIMKSVRVVTWPFRNPKKALHRSLVYTSMALGFMPIPHARVGAIGTSLALTAFFSSPAKSQELIQSPIATRNADSSIPSREEIEQMGKTPYLRYTVPAGDLDSVSNSLFQQAPYGSDSKTTIESMPRDLASNLGLTGREVWNEIPGQVAVRVILADKPVIIYQPTPQGIIPMYLADCRYKGKPWANRIKLIAPPPVMQSTTASGPANASASASAIAPPVNMNIPPFPGVITLNLTGLPQQLAIPTNTTQTIIHEVRRDKFQKLESIGKFGRDMGIGVGVSALGIKLPGAIENSAYHKSSGVKYKADRDLDIAKTRGATAASIASTNATAAQQIAVTQGQALVDAAKNRVPDQTNINTTGVNNPVVTTDTNINPVISPTNTVSPTTTVNPVISPTNNVNPVISPSTTTTNNNNAQGGGGGAGGTGGTSTPPVITVTGGNSSSTANGGIGNGGNATGNGGTSTANGGQATANGGEGGKGGTSTANGGEGGNATSYGGTGGTGNGGNVNSGSGNPNPNPGYHPPTGGSGDKGHGDGHKP